MRKKGRKETAGPESEWHLRRKLPLLGGCGGQGGRPLGDRTVKRGGARKNGPAGGLDRATYQSWSHSIVKLGPNEKRKFPR